MADYELPGPHEAKTIRARNFGEFHVNVPITIDVREDGMFKAQCGIITVTKQRPSDFYVRAAGKHGCKITR